MCKFKIAYLKAAREAKEDCFLMGIHRTEKEVRKRANEILRSVKV